VHDEEKRSDRAERARRPPGEADFAAVALSEALEEAGYPALAEMVAIGPTSVVLACMSPEEARQLAARGSGEGRVRTVFSGL